MSSGEAYDMETSFFYPLNYNMLLWALQVGQFWICTKFGWWGLFWYNDNGEMINQCMEVGLIGTRSEFNGVEDK